MKEHNNFSYLWNVEPHIPNSLGEIICEKLPNLQIIFELINVFATPLILQVVIAASSVVIDSTELKLTILFILFVLFIYLVTHKTLYNMITGFSVDL